jgi:hypothetical protein
VVVLVPLMTLWATEYSSSGRYQAVPGTSVKSETLVALAATQKHITIARIRDIMRMIRLFLLIVCSLLLLYFMSSLYLFLHKIQYFFWQLFVFWSLFV